VSERVEIIIGAKDAASSTLKRVRKELGAINGDLVRYAKYGALAFGAGLTASVVAATKLRGEMARLQAQTGATAGAIESARLSVKALARDSKFGPAEGAAGIRALTQAGLDLDTAMKALPSAASLATAGHIALGDAARSVAGVLVDFSLGGEKAAHVSDVIGKAAQDGRTSIGEMGQALNASADAAAMFGVPMEDVSAALAVMARNGTSGARAGNVYSRALFAVAKATGPAADTLKRLGINASEARIRTEGFTPILEELREKASTTDLAEIFSVRNVREMGDALGFVKGEVAGLADGYKTLAGWTENAAKVAEDSLGGALERLGSMAANLGTSFGDVFERGLTVILRDAVLPLLKEANETIEGLGSSARGEIGDTMMSVFEYATGAAKALAFSLVSVAQGIEVIRGVGAMAWGATKGIYNAYSGATHEMAAGLLENLAGDEGMMKEGNRQALLKQAQEWRAASAEYLKAGNEAAESALGTAEEAADNINGMENGLQATYKVLDRVKSKFEEVREAARAATSEMPVLASFGPDEGLNYTPGDYTPGDAGQAPAAPTSPAAAPRAPRGAPSDAALKAAAEAAKTAASIEGDVFDSILSAMEKMRALETDMGDAAGSRFVEMREAANALWRDFLKGDATTMDVAETVAYLGDRLASTEEHWKATAEAAKSAGKEQAEAARAAARALGEGRGAYDKTIASARDLGADISRSIADGLLTGEAGSELQQRLVTIQASALTAFSEFQRGAIDVAGLKAALDALGPSVGTVKTDMQSLTGTTRDTVQAIAGGIQSLVQAAADGLGNLAQDLVNGVKNPLAQFAASFLDTLGTILINVGVTTMGIGKAVTAIAATLTSMMGGFAIGAGAMLIAAGIGMKAASAAVSKAVSDGANGSSAGASAGGGGSAYSGGSSVGSTTSNLRSNGRDRGPSTVIYAEFNGLAVSRREVVKDFGELVRLARRQGVDVQLAE